MVYTTIRCSILISKYLLTNISENIEISAQKKKKIWRQAQLYLSAKVVGILLSQTVLLAIGFSSLAWGIAVFIWGGFLSGISYFAYKKSIA